MAQPGLVRKCSLIADTVRKAGKISNVDLVLKLNKSISFVEKHRPFVLKLYIDIRYQNGMWEAIKTEDIEAGSDSTLSGL